MESNNYTHRTLRSTNCFTKIKECMTERKKCLKGEDFELQ